MMTIARFTALALVSASLTLLGACTSAPPEAPPLAGARIGGAFALTDQSGKLVRDTDFAGKYRLMYFGYSYCPDVCPLDLNRLMLGLKQFEAQDPARGARVQPLFTTVDPDRDTPQALAAFVAQFHPRLLGLTGTPDQIASVARAFVVSYSKQTGSTPRDYLVAHTQNAYLMGPDGQPVALLPVDDVSTPSIDEGAPDKVAAELARWVR